MELRIPQLGASMTEGMLVEWSASDGASVEKGATLYVVETEKSAEEVEAPTSGKLRIVASAGQIYPVGELIGHLDE